MVKMTRTLTFVQLAVGAAEKGDGETGNGRGRHGSILASVVRTIRIEDEIRTESEPASLPCLAPRLQREITGQDGRRLHAHLHNPIKVH